MQFNRMPPDFIIDHRGYEWVVHAMPEQASGRRGRLPASVIQRPSITRRQYYIVNVDIGSAERGRKMELKIDLRSIYWWFWAVTLVGIIAGLSGKVEGYYGVMGVSLIQTIYFSIERGFAAFPTQVRLVYFACTVIAFFDPTRIFFWMLLVGTVMVTLFDRCIIARVLVKMPWNKGVSLT